MTKPLTCRFCGRDFDAIGMSGNYGVHDWPACAERQITRLQSRLKDIAELGAQNGGEWAQQRARDVLSHQPT